MNNIGIQEEYRSAWSVPDHDSVFWSGKTKPWLIVIPVINEGERIKNFLSRMKDAGAAAMADILIVDGGSDDGSLETTFLKSMDIAGLVVKTGPGKLGGQLRCGYAFAMDQGYEGVITIDGNDKDDPSPLPRFIEALKEGVDFAQASRFIPGGTGENTPKIRELAIRLIHAPALAFFSGFPWTDTTQGFRAYSRKLLLDPGIAPFRDVFMEYELLAYMSYKAPRLGFECREIPTARRYPPDGKTPTKISAVRGNLKLLMVLAKACLGGYDP